MFVIYVLVQVRLCEISVCFLVIAAKVRHNPASQCLFFVDVNLQKVTEVCMLII